MLARRLQFHQVDHVDDADLQRRQILAEEIHGGERFQRGNVPATGHDDVGLSPLVIAGPFPDADAGSAVFDCLVHR